MSRPLQLGDTITAESVWPENADPARGYQVAILDPDGSRRCVATYIARSGPSWPNYRSSILDLTPPGGDPILWGPTGGGTPAINPRQYAPYITADSPADPPGVLEPVNPVPWTLHWKHHLAEIAHQWVHTPADDVFHHESNTTGFSPATVTLTTAQEAKFETASKAVRRAVGVLFGKALVVDLIDPVATPNWPTVVAHIGGLVERFCGDCEGRGFKRRMLRYINAPAWAAAYAVSEGGVFYFDRLTDPTSWGVGTLVTTDLGESTNAIANFVKALIYYEQTTGDEDDHVLPAL